MQVFEPCSQDKSFKSTRIQGVLLV